jgi:hypothetical protein
VVGIVAQALRSIDGRVLSSAPAKRPKPSNCAGQFLARVYGMSVLAKNRWQRQMYISIGTEFAKEFLTEVQISTTCLFPVLTSINMQSCDIRLPNSGRDTE